MHAAEIRGRTGVRNAARLAAAALVLCAALGAAAQEVRDLAGEETTYRLTVGDVVDFDFLDDDAPPLRLVVNDRGALQAPLLGAVDVDGLTISEAVDRLRLAYIGGDLLVDPKIDLSVAAYRPIYVLGDVRKPGLIDYRPLLTVEQAVGLAGGLSTQTVSGEEQLLAEAALRGELRVIDADLAREAAVIARLRAQVMAAGAEAPAEASAAAPAETPAEALVEALVEAPDGGALSYEDVPSAVRAYVSAAAFAVYAEGEAQLLTLEQRSAGQEKALLTSEIAAREQEIALLSERATNQTAQIALRGAELERVRSLVERGLQRSNDLPRLEREMSEAEGRVLDIARQQAEVRGEIAQLRREQSRSVETRGQTALQQLQEHLVAVEKLLARRASVEERVFLAAGWESERSRTAFSIETSYTVRRGRGAAMRTLSAERIAELAPGDVLLVSIDLPSRGDASPLD